MTTSDPPAKGERYGVGPVVVEVLWVLVGVLGGWAVLSGLASVGLLPALDGHGMALLYGPAAAAIGGAAYLGVLRSRGDGAMPEPPVVVGIARTLGVTALHVIAAIGGSMILAQLMEQVGAPVTEQPLVQDIAAAAKGGRITRDAVYLAVSATVAAPLAEEWLFRGLLLRRLLRLGGPIAAYSVSALAFALIHANPAGFIVYAWLGLVFASAYLMTGRLPAAMAVHSANNIFALALLLT